MSKKTKNAAKTKRKIEALLKNIEGPLPPAAADMVKRWLLTQRPEQDLVSLLDKYARADLLRANHPNLPGNLRGYPPTVADARTLVSRLEAHNAKGRRRGRSADRRVEAKILARLEGPHPEDVRAEKRRDKNPLHGTSILRGASRAKRDRSRYHPD